MNDRVSQGKVEPVMIGGPEFAEAGFGPSSLASCETRLAGGALAATWQGLLDAHYEQLLRWLSAVGAFGAQLKAEAYPACYSASLTTLDQEAGIQEVLLQSSLSCLRSLALVQRQQLVHDEGGGLTCVDPPLVARLWPASEEN